MKEVAGGIVNLDKPGGMSSARAVDQVKPLLPRKTKIGHAGTLDPFATGVLLLLIGKATKQCERLMDLPKQYEATLKFGATTATDDLESPEEPWTPPRGLGLRRAQSGRVSPECSSGAAEANALGRDAARLSSPKSQATSEQTTLDQIRSIVP